MSDSWLGLLTHSLLQVELDKYSHFIYQAYFEWKQVCTFCYRLSRNDTSSETEQTKFVRAVRMTIVPFPIYCGKLFTSDHGMSLTRFISWCQSTNRIRRNREAIQVHMSTKIDLMIQSRLTIWQILSRQRFSDATFQQWRSVTGFVSQQDDLFIHSNHFWLNTLRMLLIYFRLWHYVQRFGFCNFLGQPNRGLVFFSFFFVLSCLKLINDSWLSKKKMMTNFALYVSVLPDFAHSQV